MKKRPFFTRFTGISSFITTQCIYICFCSYLCTVLFLGQNVVGWNMLTQLIAETNPSLVTAHIPRYIELRNSYQNRPVIGQAILWSVGQAGAKSLHSGMKGRITNFLHTAIKLIECLCFGCIKQTIIFGQRF